MRRGRFEDPVGIKDLESCPSDCYQRSNCSQCIGEPGRCVWCQERQECFQFSVYIAEYQYGQCKAWIDKDIAENEVSNSDYDQQCQTCQMRLNCSQCMEGMFILMNEILFNFRQFTIFQNLPNWIYIVYSSFGTLART